MEEKQIIINIIESNIISCFIEFFLNINQLNKAFLSLQDKEIKKLSSIPYQYYNILNGKEKNSSKLKNEIINKIKQANKNNKYINLEKIIEILFSSINIKHLFMIKKQLIEKCQICNFYKSKNILNYYYSINLIERIINDKVYLSQFFETNEFQFLCKNCKNESKLFKTELIYIPENLIIFLKYQNNFNSKIIYPKDDFNIECLIKNNEKEEKESLSYKLKSLIVKDKNNNYKTYFFSNDSNYNICKNDELKYPIIFLYQRSKIDKFDNIIENEESLKNLNDTNESDNFTNNNNEQIKDIKYNQQEIFQEDRENKNINKNNDNYEANNIEQNKNHLTGNNDILYNTSIF